MKRINQFREHALEQAKKIRTGFTLVELLVVIAIIGILVGLLLPAVQAAREAARRMQCSNNLKQLGLAAHNYHDAFKSFPLSEIFRTGSASTWGYGVFILPFIEQSALHTQLQPDGNALPTLAARPLLLTTIPAYVCPSDVGSPLNSLFSGYPKSNYLANDEVFTAQYLPPLSGAPLSIRDISDGTSNTIMIGERALKITGDFLSVGGVWAGRTPIGGAVQVIGRGAWPPNTSYPTSLSQAIGTPTDPLNKRTAWTSLHTGGVMTALCDGSVRFVSQNIDSLTAYSTAASTNGFNMIGVDRVWQNLYRRADGNPVGDF